eukprot:gnl/TRDRNA2_/TRDRNA2_143868_c0_seq2.p1 gnl/TRDRNA2_/TRDRNA2_143868_c0~~gnl/TRDRNA2_/TRDRNA2_143868_c0_seq2.p1  ORF type:complete len:308 (-),score=59.73 gnl/TRDRNA2_/TRDRNA2_143868_c0_seq2:108-965(-)
MRQLVVKCGCEPQETGLSIEQIDSSYIQPFVFGDLPAELPDWLRDLQLSSYSMKRDPIPVPLRVALMLPTNFSFVRLDADGSSDGTDGKLRASLQHEAMQRKAHLLEIYGSKDGGVDVSSVGAFDLIPELAREDALLQFPMEIFQTSFDELPHICLLLQYQVLDDQPQASVTSLELLDPRLPTRISRPKPPPSKNPLLAVLSSLDDAAVMLAQGRAFSKKRKQCLNDEWGGMKFYCRLTQICTMTATQMQHHMQGDLYKRLAASTPGWNEGEDLKRLLRQIEEDA